MDIRDQARAIAASGQVATMGDLKLQLSMHGYSNASISAAFRDKAFEQEIRSLLRAEGRPKALLSFVAFVALVAVGLFVATQMGSHR